MKHEFSTKIAAIAAGYRCVSRQHDIDTSGYNSYGYSYRNPDTNEETVLVWLTDAKNKLGYTGAFVAMYPPNDNN